ncbi:MAG: S8 family serine peptidase [Verrucomicrobiae bacterium]|nr:S8 family serine peptidase [Verrucomicrobiae bacterium]
MTQTGGNYVEGEVLVTFNESIDLESAHELARTRALEVVRHFPLLSKRHGRIHALVRAPGRTTAALLAQLRQDPNVETVEPNYLRELCDMRPPNDPFFPQLWGLRNTGQTVNGTSGLAGADVGFLRAWGMSLSATGEVVVAVIDTGVDYTHPDLAPNMWTNRAEVPGNGFDDDANGYVDDVVGYDFAGWTNDPSDSSDHGTHVAGIIAAVGNNGMGVIGVNFRARIMALKASSNGTNLPVSAVIEAVEYAAMMRQRGVNVAAINASYGSPDFSSMERDSILVAADAGIVFCAAAGNRSANLDTTPYYPACYQAPNVIVVAASDQADRLASFSSFGAANVDLAAPGVNVMSTIPASLGVACYVRVGPNVYSGNPMTYSGQTAGITGVIYDCGLGYPTNFPRGVAGNIALIRRGEIFFSVKVANAMAAGATAAIIYNHQPGNFYGTLQYPSNWIPAISISQADGLAIRALTPVVGTLVNGPDTNAIYDFKDGTSMSTPHVAGAVAFAAMCFPDETVPGRIRRILDNATPCTNLVGKTATGGRLDLARMVDTDADGLPDWWEQMYFGQATGTNPYADPDGDAQTNLEEWLAGTTPTNANSRFRITSVQALGPNGFVLEWPSADGRFYRLFAASNPALLTAPILATNVELIVQTNIAATPPFNRATNVPAPGTQMRFYRVQLEP